MATRTQGTVLNWNGTPVGEVQNISGLSAPTTKIPITTFGDSDALKFRPGRRKVGTFVFDINMNPDDTSQTAIETDRLSATEREVQLIAPTGATDTITFNAQVLNITMSAKQDDIWKSQLTLKITSIPIRS